jgi:hypothetical protein
MLQKKLAGGLRHPAAPSNRARIRTAMEQDFPFEIGSVDDLARAPPPANGAEVICHRCDLFDSHKRRK